MAIASETDMSDDIYILYSELSIGHKRCKSDGGVNVYQNGFRRRDSYGTNKVVPCRWDKADWEQGCWVGA